MAEPSRWAEIEAVCQAALDRPLVERSAFVASTCAGDDDLRREVDAILSHAESDASFLESPLGALAAHALGADADALSGTRIGVLEIGSVIGRGGMGEVYRARDTRLERDVAIKVLPTVFAADPDRLARFKREAVILASLNHPNIAAIYGVEDLGEAQALVLELVDGRTLDERLQDPLSIDEAISIARQLAEALEAAHERGVVHRDLKPANLKLRPDGVVKILDFGLATAFHPALAPVSSPADTHPGAAGVSGVFGTPKYMSPEQRARQATDRRVDVWAFGVILYEMLAGRGPGAGAGAESIDWAALPRDIPDALRQLIARCLERNPRQRLRDIGEARVVLEQLASGVPSPRVGQRRQRRWRLLMPAAGALIAAAVAGTGVWWVTRPSVGPVTRMALALDGEAALFVDPQSSDVAISPDGRQVVYKGGSRGDRTRLFVRGLDRLEPVALTEPGLPKSPFLSPNGEWVGYFEPGTSLALKKVAIGGGPSQVLAYLHGPSRGASWGTDGTIVASTATALKSFGLTRVAETGGDAQVLTTPDTGRGEGDHLWPHHLPDGKSLLFTVSTVTGSRDASVVELLDLVTGERRPILRGASQARYLRSGHLVYVAGDSLWAVAFDLNRRETSGPARVVAPHVLILPTGTAEFDIADDGTLVYVADTAALTRRRLVWVDRNGGEEEIAEAPPRFYAEPRLSPDGMRIAVAADDDERDIWSWDISRRVLSRVTTGPAIDQSPLWSADGRRLFFLSTRGGGAGSLFSQAADGGGVAERVTDSRIVREPSGMLADGRVLYTENDDIMSVTADPPRRVLPVVRTPALERKGTVSPDGRWIAFESLDAGAVQVFVRPFPNVEDARVQISTDGGLQPRWSRDGRELFFLAIDGTLMGVHVERGTSWSAGYPAPIVPRNVFADVSMSLRAFDVAPDGQRFIVVKGAPGSAVPAPRIIVVQNWLAEIARGSRQ